jgi:hypothetical protein
MASLKNTGRRLPADAISGRPTMNWFQSFWRSLTGVATDPTRVPVHIQPGGESKLADETMSNFTPRATQVLALARREAGRLHHDVISTEHLLLGLIALGQGVAVNVLGKMGLDLETVRAEVEKLVGTAPEQVKGNIPYTPRVKKVLALASKQAKALNHTYVGTEHILLGILQEGGGVASQVLRNLGVDLEKTRLEILKELDPNFEPAPDTAKTSPSRMTTGPTKSTSPPQGEPVDTSKRYDVHCTDWSQGVTVYSNVRFKGMKHLFQKSQYDALSGYLELEQADGQTIFVSRSSIIKFCEHGAMPGPESSGSKLSSDS